MELNFEFFNEWVQRKLGIRLGAYKERQMQRRISNIMESAGAASLEQYAKILETDSVARHAFVEHLTINVTEFYRNKSLFDMFEQRLLEQIVPKFDHPKIWSAACSIGAEPYTLAMILAKNNVAGGRIVATDIDDEILKKAKAGLYQNNEVKNVTSSDLNKYFVKTDDNKYQVSAALKNKITFKKHDLLKDRYESGCHVIVCRNVTIYFKPDARDEVYRKLSESLVQGGILFTGATETISLAEQMGLKKVDSFIYQKI
ncbi:chemotaxis protein methyltransferase CheR [Liquorilactobacillus sucicola DSM 21376 = JCM 15457]|uniref:protein-glutamate O-methyltransferase n=2 Tax=Liquorilactobacillus sucicola TaxID=519050 RepID=A0A023CWU9_9LACO|nr:protein-glutamate O-methyltransferase CheR [Liquorilactobacillus sucicola]AJA34358.1 chemotaxis protein methyltransferase CheR [Liquorilactobacillus sucicola]KRN06860.1 protein-glutamate O-methyltransferase [Liquorilactobacillus sucicola DSM 21376 = JCM 15457]GAJ26337.1 chemotaxis protein methyltransferase CheR [Liquorilactobacillus sucicola DSM 21376 = JCM 15457]